MTKPFISLEIRHESLASAYAQVPGRISEYGAAAAEARVAHQRAEHERKREEALCYQLARAQLEMPAPGDGEKKASSRGPTEAQVEAHMRTSAQLAGRLLAACEKEWLAEADYEVARSNFQAVRAEADLVAEAARDRRAELANLDPTLRFPAPARFNIEQEFPPFKPTGPVQVEKMTVSGPGGSRELKWEELPLLPGYRCGECKKPVRTTPLGGAVCELGHGGAEEPIPVEPAKTPKGRRGP